jgi:hypothetical protein
MSYREQKAQLSCCWMTAAVGLKIAKGSYDTGVRVHIKVNGREFS